MWISKRSAAHRGSAFGANGAQPNQVDFENGLAFKLLQLRKTGEPVLIEDESRRIGQRSIPEALFLKMQSSPKIQLNVAFHERVEKIFEDYILKSKLGTRNDIAQFEEFQRSVNSISRRLGGLRAREILNDLEFSKAELMTSHGLDSNRVWIGKLLQWYYDPLYRQWILPK